MKFEIRSTDWNRDEIIEHYPFLNDFGFRIEDLTLPHKTPIMDENGKRIYQVTTRIVQRCYIEIETLERFMDLSERVGEGAGLIVFPKSEVYNANAKKWEDVDIPLIEIYDGYRE